MRQPLRSSCKVVIISGMCALALSGHLACAQESEPARESRELVAQFKQNLQQALRAGMAKGPVEAIAACQIEAPEIAAGLSRDGVRVGRTSHRLRNPTNASPDWVKPILDAYLADASNRAPRTVVLPDGQSGYVEPIIAQPLCLTCHGKTLAPAVASRIKELYPEDEAVGFEVGDLRGAFWVVSP